MNYDVIAVEQFQRDIKKLAKKYKSIKYDILDLIEKLELDYNIGIDLGNNLYKIRIKNSDIGGKSGGYRVIYYTILPKAKIYLLTIYSKTQKENIDMKSLKSILEQIKESLWKY